MICLLLAGCAPELDLPPPSDLPERVSFRTATESFNRWWYFALRDGRIWLKPNEETGERAPGAWELVGRTGLPEGPGLDRWDPPEAVVEISADGAHLQAISAEGHFYRATDARTDLHHNPRWTDRWGWPAAHGPGLSTSWSTARGWSVSDSHPFEVAWYEDVLGLRHSVGLGVAHVYRLTEDGREVAFNDWWLPADWSRRICGPERGTFEAVAISASASTILLLGRGGEIWTRLYDFDTSGENDLLRYSYALDGPDGKTRALPAEPWLRQPDPPGGRLTTRTAIAQDGAGNAARLLRVEAEVDGASGYWEKHLFDEDWRWVETAAPLGPFLDELPAAAPPVPPEGARLVGPLTREDLDVGVSVELLDFDLVCSPARARLLHRGVPVTAGGAPVELELHHVPALVEQARPDDALDQEAPVPVRAALLLGAATPDDDDAALALAALFGEREVVNFAGTATRGALELEEIPRATSGLVPYGEKGAKGELFRLRAEERP